MIILGIETSCDETAAAVVKDGKIILSNVIASSQSLHAKTGGIVPEVAARQQIKSILPVITQALSKAFPHPPFINHKSLIINQIDALAVTVGPGLIGSLLVGVETAKTLASIWEKPIVPVNHLLGHIYANWLEPKKLSFPQFPLLALVVSGGHTDMVYLKNHDNIIWLGGTRDDAAGEAFDKIARLLGLPYPGGPAIAAKAESFQFSNPNFQLNLFPRPMMDSDNYDFSFSGLKTAVSNYIKSFSHQSLVISHFQLAAEVQEAIIDVLIEKSIKAIRKYKTRSFVLGGGVSANKRLNSKFADRLKKENLKLKFFSLPNLATDNAAMIAAAAFYNYKPVPWQKIMAKPELTISEN